jgi:protein-S-isoprenylcysteine O-methyltransferase Ste14
MSPLPFQWPWALIFWGVFIWAFAIESRIVMRSLRDVRDSRDQDAGSLRFIMLMQWVALVAAAWFAFYVHALDVGHRAVAFWAGIMLIIAGSALRRHCFRMLGEFFTGQVKVRDDHQVVDRGAYRWIRHPAYTAGMLMMTGVGVGLGNWGSALAMLIVSAVAYAYRVRVEERALLTTIGDPYRAYMARTKRFIPFVF